MKNTQRLKDADVAFTAHLFLFFRSSRLEYRLFSLFLRLYSTALLAIPRSVCGFSSTRSWGDTVVMASKARCDYNVWAGGIRSDNERQRQLWFCSQRNGCFKSNKDTELKPYVCSLYDIDWYRSNTITGDSCCLFSDPMF